MDEITDGADAAPTDGRRAVTYLVAPESDEYIAIMSVLEGAPNDMTPTEVSAALRTNGASLDVRVVETRLAQLREWSAVSARSDQTHVRRVQDLLLRNFRYTATREGRQVQRFYDTVLSGATVMREIPLQSLNAVVLGLEELAPPDANWSDVAWVRSKVNEIFTAHDDLDGSLVGAEDTLMGLADRFDLDDDGTGELKTLLVGYATRIAVELERGADRAWQSLRSLSERFDQLATITVDASAAADLIGRDLLAASKGGHADDWHGLVAWFHPTEGRSARFQARMVRAIPTFHANLRRLHTAGETGTSRARALAMARAAIGPRGREVFIAALGDHPWRKLYSEADDPGAGRIPPWREGPQVAVPPGLRAHGRSGVRGRAPAPLDDTLARQAVAHAREERLARHLQQLREVLAAQPGATMSHGAARIALATLMDALRQAPRESTRRASREGLACTVFWSGKGAGLIASPSWRVWLPKRVMVFHRPGDHPAIPKTYPADPGGPAEYRTEGVVA